MSFSSVAADRTTGAYHTLDVAQLAAGLDVDPEQGLAGGEAATRLSRYGGNVIEEKPRRSALAMIVSQFADFMILVLMAAAAISGVVGDVKDTVVIVAIVVVNAVIGFTQEFRAEKALSSLKQLVPEQAVVVRDGRHVEVRAAEIVPGDVVVLEAGAQVPADLRLTDARQVRIGEAALTGESVPVDKGVDALVGDDLPLGDRRNMAYKGTTVTYGRGRGIAVATGMATELGKVAELLDAGLDTQTPLQQRLAQFGKWLALVILAICAVIFAAGLLRGEPAVLMFLTAVSLAVAAIPEALPATVTIALAFGARKMADLNALVRRLSAVETLGSVTFICSDKTGTLTRNEMQVDEIVTAEGTHRQPHLKVWGEPWVSLFAAAALNNDAHAGEDGAYFGDPTEVALSEAALAQGLDLADLSARFPRAGELVFDSDRKRMTTIHPSDGGYVAYTKGAPEAVIGRCTAMLTAEGRDAIDARSWLAEAERMAEQGLRVLAVAERHWPGLPQTGEADAVESDLVLLGLIGIIDPPRPEALEAVRLCQSAGITPVMITGDHPATARAIAVRLGIMERNAPVVAGAELAVMPDAALGRCLADTRVFARVDPAQKIRVVEALQKRGEFVAVTGDGVNDAPALNRADIGVAMGKIGTDVAREVSGLVLLDDNFATIVAAVREGRRIYDNLRKVIKYIMTGNAGEIWTIFLAPFLGLPIPLLPIQILWVNLVTDGLPALAMTAEPEERNIMQRPPRPPQESAFAGGVWQHMLWVGGMIGGVTLAAQAYAIGSGSPDWQTIAFTVLTFAQGFQALAIRSDRLSLFQQGLLSNTPMLGAVGLIFVLQLVIIYVPALNPIFNTTPLTAGELAFAVGMAAIVFVALEAEKWLVRVGLIRR
jgi:Ca2+-transporting ATPase